MKRNTINAFLKFWASTKQGFKAIFTKKVYCHLDNVDPILNLMREGDFKDLPVSQRIAIKEQVEKEFEKDLLKIKRKSEQDIESIDLYFLKKINN